ncbi:hypothetical protein VKT23_010878 [Stygiomarasmius scandens]|uniref:F-box domain-containing protein n=1 Tax=Marasmiellus scandens TaxID=2682957 RepID=A0ABR1JD41_9AGAR
MSLIPRVPVELVESIVEFFWDNSDLSPLDRKKFMRSSLLINYSWASIFLRIFSRNVYIPSPEFAFQLRNALAGERFRSFSSLEIFERLSELMPRRCRSLTFQYSGNSSQLFVHRQDYEHSPIGSSIFSMLRCLSSPSPSTSPLPNLRTISLDFDNCTPANLFTYNKFQVFPSQVTSLSIIFRYAPSLPTSLIQSEIILDPAPTGVPPCALPHIRQLTLFGCSIGAVRDIVNACPGVESHDAYTSDVPRFMISHKLALARVNVTLKCQRAQREIAEQGKEIQREKWRKVVQAAGYEETLKALGLKRAVGDGPDMGRELKERLDEIRVSLGRSRKRNGDLELERMFLEKWVWVIEQEKMKRRKGLKGFLSRVFNAPKTWNKKIRSL